MRFLSVVLAFSATLSLSAAEQGITPRNNVDELLEKRDVIDEIWNTLISGATCAACETILVLLKGLALIGDDAFIDTLQGICTLTGTQDADVCDGTLALEGPIIAQSIREIQSNTQSSQLLCNSLIGLCDYPAVRPYTMEFPSPKPPSKGPRLCGPGKKSGKKPIKIVHYSDIHIDHVYETGATTNCTKPICCRPYTPDDVPGVSDSPAGPFGEHTCDSPISLEKSMHDAIRELVPDAEFAIFTGDIVDHAMWNTTVETNEFKITWSYDHMDSAPIVYGTAGNHEAHPSNVFLPIEHGSTSQWIYDVLTASWSRWLGPTALESSRVVGAYSTLHSVGEHGKGGLRIISLNTNMFYVQNYYLFREEMDRDPNGQLAWLIKELDAAEKAGERVYLIGHVAPGLEDAFHDQSNYLDQIVNRYSDTIAATFWGHTHIDHFQISYSDYAARSDKNALSIAYIAPSLTPTSGMPAFRVYTVDPDNFAVLDHTTYIAPMDDPSFATSPKWVEHYSVKKDIAPLVDPTIANNPRAEISPAFWHNYTALLESNPDEYNKYIARKSRGWQAAPPCDADCRAKEVCFLRGGRSEDNCYVRGLGLPFKKRDLDAHEHKDECGSNVMRDTLSSLGVRKDAIERLTGDLEKLRKRDNIV